MRELQFYAKFLLTLKGVECLVSNLKFVDGKTLIKFGNRPFRSVSWMQYSKSLLNLKGNVNYVCFGEI